MAAAFLIIDGYNLMHAAGLARASYGPGDLARKRLELLVKLSRRLTGEERKRCTVVFDALDAPSDLPRRFKHHELVVIFAEPGHEADEAIEGLISQHSAPRQLTVVSSDHRIQNAVRRRKGTAIDSDPFLNQLESPHRRIGTADAPMTKDNQVADDLDFWMQEFQGLSANQIDAEIQAESGEKKSQWDRHIEQLQQQMNDPGALENWLNEHPGGRPKPIREQND